jgi:hypothetical protein
MVLPVRIHVRISLANNKMLPLNYTYYFILILSCVLAWLNFKKFDASFKILAVLLTLTVFTESMAYYYAIKYRNNSIVYSIVTPIQFYLFSAIYSVQLSHERVMKYVLWFFILAFSFITIYKFSTEDMFARFPTGLVMIESLFLYILVLMSFLYLAYENGSQLLVNNGMFWLNTGLVFFLTSTFLIWGFHEILIDKKNINAIFKFVLLFSNMILYSFICVGIVKERIRF